LRHDGKKDLKNKKKLKGKTEEVPLTVKKDPNVNLG
jgi:hypothetical protein